MENTGNTKKNEVLKMSNAESNLFTKNCIRTALLSFMEIKTFEVDGDFEICFSDIISLKGVPKECKGFDCSECYNLTSLKGAPEKCKGFDCSYCEKLTSLEGAPTKCEEFYCRHCKGNFTEEDVRKVCDAKKIYN